MESGFFELVANFFYMGGKWKHVWSCYALVFLVLLLNLIIPKISRDNIEHSIKRSIRRNQDQNSQQVNT